jgi:hypothetical protein
MLLLPLWLPAVLCMAEQHEDGSLCAGCMQALCTLAVGHLPCQASPWWTESTARKMCLPAAMSQLSALSSLTLHDFRWHYDPNGLPRLPQVLDCS